MSGDMQLDLDFNPTHKAEGPIVETVPRTVLEINHVNLLQSSGKQWFVAGLCYQ